MRVHVVGGSGVGTTTLGKALADVAGAALVDTDDYFWEPTDPPYRSARPRDVRLELLTTELDRHDSWVLSGSLCGWGDPLIPRFERVVFLEVPTAIRLDRLRARERDRFGTAALAPGGAIHENHVAFLEWAAGYDDGGTDMRSRARHEEWLADLPCEVIRLDGERPIEQLVERLV